MSWHFSVSGKTKNEALLLFKLAEISNQKHRCPPGTLFKTVEILTEHIAIDMALTISSHGYINYDGTGGVMLSIHFS